MEAKCEVIEARVKELRGVSSLSELTPEDVVRSLPNIRPLDQGAFLQELHKKGHYRIIGQSLSSLPQMDWMQLYTIICAKVVQREADLAYPLSSVATSTASPVAPR